LAKKTKKQGKNPPIFTSKITTHQQSQVKCQIPKNRHAKHGKIFIEKESASN